MPVFPGQGFPANMGLGPGPGPGPQRKRPELTLALPTLLFAPLERGRNGDAPVAQSSSSTPGVPSTCQYLGNNQGSSH
ncbi:hypothetical protein HJFPF1_00565 [Paramyrothecium foliicola]|nr:hypothetical protein HJFPF1_00565 [Paramyrothecium foliicola]